MSVVAVRSYRGLIYDDLVVDGEVEEPRPGVVVVVGFRAVRPWGDRAHDEMVEHVVGDVRWTRYDERGDLLETEVDAGEFRFLTQERGPAPAAVVGDRVELQTLLISVRPYEFGAFGLPDVTTEWRVLDQRPHRVGENYQVELVPLGTEREVQ